MNSANSELTIFDEIKKLNLPKDKYVVVGGGVLVALDIHEWDGDVDFAVSQDIFEELKNRGWHQEKETTKTVLRYQDYDIGVDFGEWKLDELLEDALVINDIPFISLDKLVTWKLQKNRPKDKLHIQMIQDYQKNKKLSSI